MNEVKVNNSKEHCPHSFINQTVDLSRFLAQDENSLAVVRVILKCEYVLVNTFLF